MVKKTLPALTSYEELLGIDKASEDEIVYLPYEYLYPSPYQYRDRYLTPAQIQDNVMKLAFDVKVDRKIRQPCIVRYTKPRKENVYELVVGHNRKRVAQYLTEVEHLEGYRLVPCIILELTDAQAEYLCNSSNNMRPKTEYEILHELETKMRLLKETPEDFPHLQGPGRIVEKLAQEMYLSKSTVGEYLQIGKNLSDEAMEKFASGEITKSAAVALSSLPQKEQNSLVEQGITKHKDIKAYKDEKIERTVHRTTVTDTVKSTTEHRCEAPQKENYVINSEDFGCDVLVEEPLDGQYQFDSPDMEIIEQCVCPNCKCATQRKEMYVFKDKTFCTCCLADLIQDLCDTGVIALDKTDIETKGIVVRS